MVEYSNGWLETNVNTKVLAGYAFPVYELGHDVVVSGFDSSNGSLGGTVMFSQAGDSDGVNIQNMRDIRRVCKETDLVPEVLICDIEGAESVNLNTPLRWPSTISHVLIELHPHKFPQGELDSEKICHAILKEGFALKESIGTSYWFYRD